LAVARHTQYCAPTSSGVPVCPTTQRDCCVVFQYYCGFTTAADTSPIQWAFFISRQLSSIQSNPKKVPQVRQQTQQSGRLTAARRRQMESSLALQQQSLAVSLKAKGERQ